MNDARGMSCKRIAGLYDAYRRGLLSERGNRQVEEHLARCPACHEEFEENEALKTLIAETSEPPEMPPAYYQRLAALTIRRLGERHGALARLREWWGEQVATLNWQPPLRHAVVGVICLSIGLAFSLVGNNGSEPTEPKIVKIYLPLETPATPPPNSNTAPHEMTTVAHQSMDQPPQPPLPKLDHLVDNNLDPKFFPDNWMQGVKPPTIASEFSQDNWPFQEDDSTHDQTNNASPDSIDKGLPKADQKPAPPPVIYRRPFIQVDSEAVAALQKTVEHALDRLQRERREEPRIVEVRVAQPPTPPQSEVEWNRLLNNIQQIKLDLYQKGELAELKALRQVETDITAARQGGADPTRAPLASYRQAEDALLAGKYIEAMTLYHQLTRSSPGTMLAALSRLQMANIRFDLRDFDGAFQDYKGCIHQDQKYLTPAKVEQVLQRIQMIADNDTDAYRPLRLYLLAQKAKGAEAVSAYQQLLDDYPASGLSLTALKHLRQLAVYADESARVPVSTKHVMGIIQRYGQRQQAGSVEAATAQLVLADLYYYRLHNPRQARLEYGRIFEMTDDEAVLNQTRTQLKHLTALELLDN